MQYFVNVLIVSFFLKKLFSKQINYSQDCVKYIEFKAKLNIKYVEGGVGLKPKGPIDS